MGSMTMPAILILLGLTFFLGAICEKQGDENKPSVVDWEANNFGIRTSHSHADILNTVNIDANAPQIPKKEKPSRHESRKKQINPSIIRNKLRILNRTNQEFGLNQNKIDNQVNGNKSEKRNIGSNPRREGFRSARLRSKKNAKHRVTTQSVLNIEAIRDTLKSSADRYNLMGKISSKPKRFRQRNFRTQKPADLLKITSITQSRAEEETEAHHFLQKSANFQIEAGKEEIRKKKLKARKKNKTTNNIIDDDIEFVPKIASQRKIWDGSIPARGRKIPEIADPSIEKKLNRLTKGERSEARQNRNPNSPWKGRYALVRSREVILNNVSTEEPKKKDTTNPTKEKESYSTKLQVRRPPGFMHQVRSNNNSESRDIKYSKMIRRMRVKSRDSNNFRVVSGKEQKKKVFISESKMETNRSPRLRISKDRQILTGSRKLSRQKSKSNTSIKPLLHTTTTTTTTEKITISPNAHKISYTLNDSDFMDIITSQNPLMMADHKRQDQTGHISIEDNWFSQATHQVMKARKTSSETFLPTLVPLVRKTPGTNEAHEVPIFEAGTRQADQREMMVPAPVKRGRYILAATSNG